ncbi:MAG: WbqC family protein [Gammaproteobacteria bacterium]|nr:WbqC family protein [Gammaproteobacteria bacterium]
MGKKVAILQSNYIPWKGYFDLINSVDEFILYDEMQYTKNDWRNRNRIKTAQGVQWLTIPVKQESLSQTIRETRTAADNWGSKHAKTLMLNYGRSRCFRKFWPLFEPLYIDGRENFLSKINFEFIRTINDILGIDTHITWSSNYRLLGDRSERLVSLCEQADADEYITGPSALDYMDGNVFRRSGISVKVVDYGGYPEYTQLYPPFEHGVSILDLIFNEGLDARKYMKTFPEIPCHEAFLRDAFQ